jgi:hypothetical protein
MKSTELRIGNLVNSKKHDKIIPCDYKAIVNAELGGDGFDGGDNITPIKLTEEWLRNFGFEKEMRATDKGVNNYGESGLRLEPTGGWINTREREKIVVFPDWEGKQVIIGRTCMRYVHELQNLFFALTKEELVLAVNPL